MATSILPGTTRSGGHARTYRLGAGLRMRGATSGRVGILPPTTITDYDLTLPVALGASDKLLQVSSAGVVSLVDPVSPAGTGTEIQFNNSGVLGAVAGSSWNGTILTVPRLASTGRIRGTNFRAGDAGEDGYSISIGNGAALPSRSTVIGVSAGHANASYGITIGESAGRYCQGASNHLIGYFCGYNLTTSSTNNIFIGQGTQGDGSTHVVNSIVFGGYNYVVKESNAFIATTINNVYFGKGVTHATPTAWTLNGTGGFGTNVVGGNLYIAPGPSTGNATPSAVVIQSTVAGTSGSTAQTLVDTLTVTNNLVRLAATTYQYWGPEGTDGSWRIGRSGDDFVIERREAGAWVTKSTIAA